MTKILSFILALLAVPMVLGAPSAAVAQSDECLLEVHDANGALADPATLCQTTTTKSCVFELQLCLNQPAEGCLPADFTKKEFRARGHCGPVGKLRVQTAGSAPVCGDLTAVKVHTKASGKKPGRCTIRTAVRSSATHARTDVDKVTLICNPPSTPCPSTTTTTTIAGSSTTTSSSTTSTTL